MCIVAVTFGGSVWVRGKGNGHKKVHVSLFNLIKLEEMSKNDHVVR